jgi:GMP synthase-like glutamine amidotransferase
MLLICLQKDTNTLIIFASMNFDQPALRIAILDLYEGQPNQGMRCIRQILKDYSKRHHLHLQVDEFEVRLQNQLPDLSYEIYISTGGPGSPLESTGNRWEVDYFRWLAEVEQWNAAKSPKKFVYFICHSFQLACRYFKVAEVTKRRSTAFGIFPVHMLEEGKEESVFADLPDPFYAVDSRDYQIVQPHTERMHELGASVLCIEKDRPHIPLERAIMGIRFNEYMIGTQFHPEADATGMTMYLQREDKKKTVIESHGFDKWESMIEHLNDPDKILLTYSKVLPNFLDEAIKNLRLFN